jgi:bifunctional UDP-N-acetylglucosamine pyrophosphorylase/glucosamine-1-phosphate N-acetyltransferase
MTQDSLANTTALILAAGFGTRMKSQTPKVLHAICGQPLVYYPIKAALDAGCADVVVVVGHGRAEVEAYLAKAFGSRVRTALQAEQRGTGDAARAGLSAVTIDAERLLVFYGDVPLLLADDVARVARALGDNRSLAVATCSLDDPTGYGRIVRDDAGHILEIREQKDLRNDAERAIREINPGIYASSVSFFTEALASLQPNNAQGELYLTDIIAYAAKKSWQVVGVDSRAEVLVGVNDRRQLVSAEETMFLRIAEAWRVAGATVRAGARIEPSVTLEQDAVIEAGTHLRGKTHVGKGAIVDVGCVLSNVRVGASTVIKPYSVLTDSTVGENAQIGPFSHVRPDCAIGDEAHIGNFVEAKKTTIGRGSKANHLAYLGDGVIGAGANIGAGTIFCNYDGFLKHTTVIEDGAFIGSDSQLVAPVRVGKQAYVATGTTVTKDVPDEALAIARVSQENKLEYARKLRARMKAAKEAQKSK